MYSNNPQKIFGSNHNMSTPQLHAQVLSLLGDRIGPGKVACEIGAGSGYLPTVFARAGCRQVYAIEKDSDLLSTQIRSCRKTEEVCGKRSDIEYVLATAATTTTTLTTATL